MRCELPSKDRVRIFLSLVLAFVLWQENRPLWAFAEKDATRDGRELFTTSAINPLELDGPWEFYSGVFLDQTSQRPQPDHILPHIKQWTAPSMPARARYKAFGSATYRMLIKDLPATPEGYSLFFKSFDSALRLIIYGRGEQKVLAFAEAGKPGSDSEEPSFEPKLIQIFPTQTQDVEIYMQISNHTLPYGGMWMPPSIGRGYSAFYPVFFQSILVLACAGVVICALINNLMLWWRDRKEYAALVIAFCAVACLFRIFGTDVLGMILLKDFPILVKRFEFGSIPAMSIFALYSILTFDSYLWQRRLVLALCYSSIPSVLMCAFTSPSFFPQFLSLFQVQVLGSIFMSMWIAFQNIRTKREGYRINVFGFTVAFFLVFWDVILVSQYKIFSLWLSPIAGALYVLFQSEILAQRAAQSKRKAQELAIQNAAHQEQLRLETEARFQLASDLAHHLNNPLNHIAYASLGLQTALQNLRSYLNAALTDQAAEDPDALEFQKGLEFFYREFEPHFSYITSAVDRGSVAIKEIRYLSGVDGYTLETYSVFALKEALIKRLTERFPRFEQELVLCQIEEGCTGKVQGNFYVFLHVIELFCQTFLAKEDKIRDLHLLQSKSGELHLKYHGEHVLTGDVGDALEKKLNYILRPFSHEVVISKEVEGFEILYRPQTWDTPLSPKPSHTEMTR